MLVEQITARIASVGAQDPERQLFDAFMPLHHGTTYNSYLIRGSEATALIDPVDAEKYGQLTEALDALGVRKLDYIINLHTEQDHSGSTKMLRKRYPGVQLVGMKKVIELMGLHHHIAAEDFREIPEGGSLSLGDLTLEFYGLPFAHWPDNSAVLVKEEGVLMTSDLFGAHLATGSIFTEDLDLHREMTRAYYAEIMMPFRNQVKKHVAKIKALDAKILAPAHGPVWTKPDEVISLYEAWTGNEYRRHITIGYVSMHESVEKMVFQMAKKLSALGMPYSLHNLGAHTDSLMRAGGDMVTSCVDDPALILAAPTVLTNPHPTAMYAAVLVDTLKPKLQFLSYVGSFAWGSKAPQTIEALTSSFKGERLEPFVVKGDPGTEDLEKLEAYIEDLVRRVDAFLEEE